MVIYDKQVYKYDGVRAKENIIEFITKGFRTATATPIPH